MGGDSGRAPSERGQFTSKCRRSSRFNSQRQWLSSPGSAGRGEGWWGGTGEGGPPGLPVLPHQADKGLHLCFGDVLLQELAVVVQQGSDGVFSQDVIANLGLHHPKLLGDVLLGTARLRVTGGPLCSRMLPPGPADTSRGPRP